MSPLLDERSRRLWAAAESRAIGYGGDALVSSATGLARQTIHNGRKELEQGVEMDGRIRRPGAGRPGIEEPGFGSLFGARSSARGLGGPSPHSRGWLRTWLARPPPGVQAPRLHSLSRSLPHHWQDQRDGRPPIDHGFNGSRYTSAIEREHPIEAS